MRRALSPARDNGPPSRKEFTDTSNHPPSLAAELRDFGESQPLDLPTCPQTVIELFSDELDVQEWVLGPLGDDLDAIVAEAPWNGGFPWGDEDSPRNVDAPPPQAVEPALVQTQTPAIESESAHFDGAEAIRQALAVTRSNAFKELRDPPDMPFADMLTVASKQGLRRAGDYLHKAGALHQEGHPEGACAFALLFLATGLLHVDVAGLDPCDHVSHAAIQGLDAASRKVLERQWQLKPDGPWRALVMGSDAALHGIQQPSTAADSQTGHGPPVLETLKKLVAAGKITSKHLVPLIEQSHSLRELQTGARKLTSAAAICILAAAATLKKKGRHRGARYVALVFLMTMRRPAKHALKGYTLNQLISRDEAMALSEQLELQIRMDDLS